MAYVAKPPAARFASKVEPDTNGGCWLWAASLDAKGYGKIGVGRTGWGLAHRLSWETHHGPIPEGLFVCHKCDVRACVTLTICSSARTSTTWQTARPRGGWSTAAVPVRTTDAPNLPKQPFWRSARAGRLARSWKVGSGLAHQPSDVSEAAEHGGTFRKPPMTEPKHEMRPDGESTAKWAIREPGFAGSIKQLLHCARCGNLPPFKRRDEPRNYRDFGKPTFHLICDDCYNELPE